MPRRSSWMGLPNLGALQQGNARPISFNRRYAASVRSLWSSKGRTERERKDPSKWRSIDELRQHLEQPQGVPGGFSSLLTWLSQNSFGESTGLRGLAALYRWLLRVTPTPVRLLAGRQRERRSISSEALSRAQQSPLTGILIISPYALAAMAAKFPDVYEMSLDEAVGRLTGIKVLLPMCDVSHLVVTEPRLYLANPRADVEEQLRCSLALLDDFSVPNQVVQAMISHDPALPWVVTRQGLEELRQLWPPELVDTQALIDSDPRELALAVRALSTRLK